MNFVLQAGKALLPVGLTLNQAFGLKKTLLPQDLKDIDEGAAIVEEFGAGGSVSSDYVRETLYGVSFGHVVVGAILGVLLAVPLGFAAKKGVRRYRRTRALRSTRASQGLRKRSTYYRRKR